MIHNIPSVTVIDAIREAGLAVSYDKMIALHEFSDWTVYSVLLEAAVHMKKNNLFCDEEKTAE